jgi:hypothetical protein
MVNLQTLVLFATAVTAAAIKRRDAATILTDLANIDTATNTLNADVNAWDGTVLGALGIAQDGTDIATLVNQATTDTQATSTLDSADTESILDYITNTGTPDIETALNALVAREADFASIDLTSAVLSTIQTLQTDVDNLGAALLVIASSDQITNAETALSALDADFTTAIAAFS